MLEAKSPLRFDGNQPSRPLRRPSRRHQIARVTQRTLTRQRNTVIEPWVDVIADVAAINAGRAHREGNTLEINDRIYGVEPSGTLYPISGRGFIELNRQAYKALGIYNQFEIVGRAAEILDAMQIDEVDRQAARDAWRAGRHGTN